jgi:hypothetical protein
MGSNYLFYMGQQCHQKTPECNQEHPRHVNLESCSVPDRCHCTCHEPARLNVDLDETPNPNF